MHLFDSYAVEYVKLSRFCKICHSLRSLWDRKSFQSCFFQVTRAKIFSFSFLCCGNLNVQTLKNLDIDSGTPVQWVFQSMKVHTYFTSFLPFFIDLQKFGSVGLFWPRQISSLRIHNNGYILYTVAINELLCMKNGGPQIAMDFS